MKPRRLNAKLLLIVCLATCRWHGGAFQAPSLNVGRSSRIACHASSAVQDSIKNGAMASAGSAATWLLQYGKLVEVPMSNVQAASTVGVLAGVLLPLPLRLACYCGAFVGMASKQALASALQALLVGFAAGSLVLPFLDGRRPKGSGEALFQGCGGRLGFAAMLTCAAWVYLQALWGARPSGMSLVALPLPPLSISLTGFKTLLVSTLLGALATKGWMNVMGRSLKGEYANRLANSVTASGLVGCACFCLPVAVNAGAVFAGSFVAMSAPTVLASYKEVAIAAILTAIVQALMGGILTGGWSGRLGTAAVVGVVLFRAMKDKIMF